jgi:uncharacterized membrane protein
MQYAAAYAAILVVFVAIDAVWLSAMGSRLYRPALGDILLDEIRIAPAIAFYLIYPLGVLVFGTMPALRAGTLGPALMYGALFGFMAYATYDLTNFATLRNWTLTITLADVVWGAFITATAASAGYAAARMVSGEPA